MSALVPQKQHVAVVIGDAQAAAFSMDTLYIRNRSKGGAEPRQFNGENLPAAAGSGIADKIISVIFPGVPVRQVLPDMVAVIQRSAARAIFSV